MTTSRGSRAPAALATARQVRRREHRAGAAEQVGGDRGRCDAMLISSGTPAPGSAARRPAPATRRAAPSGASNSRGVGKHAVEQIRAAAARPSPVAPNPAAISTRVLIPSGDTQASAVVGEAVRAAGTPQRHAEHVERVTTRLRASATSSSERAMRGDHHLPGIAQLGRRRAPGVLVGDQRAGERAEVAVRVGEGLRQPRRPTPSAASRRRRRARACRRCGGRSPARGRDRRARPRPARRRLQDSGGRAVARAGFVRVAR